jgi:hypothetical protein
MEQQYESGMNRGQGNINAKEAPMVEYKMTFSKDFDNLVSALKQADTNPAKKNSEVLRNAVALYSYLHQQVAANPGNRVAIVNKDNQIVIEIDPLP